MTHLSIDIIGPLQVSIGDEPLAIESAKVGALLAYLAVESDHAHKRTSLVGLLWPEYTEESARHNLRRALFDLHKALGDQTADTPYLMVTHETIQFNRTSDYSLDLDTFNRYFAPGQESRSKEMEILSSRVPDLEEMIKLYRGDFLQQLTLDGCVEYEEWVLMQRESLHQRVVEAHSSLVSYYEQHADFQAAGRHARRQLELDPWREEAHRQMMRVLALDGQRSAALAQFESCRKILMEELGVDPSSKTIELYEQIRSDTLAPKAELRPQTSIDVMQADWLPQTKFVPPCLREDYVPRKRLLDVIYTAISSHPLILISAPAGYGKTTLLTSLPAAVPDHAVAWMSLEDEDNDTARFLIALARALQEVNSDLGRNLQSLIATLPNPANESRRVISALINNAQASHLETWLVMDDLHLITEPAVFSCLDYLLERCPPQFHLIIATRYDPPLALARLRARGLIAELRAPDLRFTMDEAGVFLNENHHLSLTQRDLSNLQGRTEGWAAGLRLLAGSLDHLASADDRSAFIDDLALTDRYIFDFLADEVLQQQGPDIREFLSATSVLQELTPSLCNALTGRNDAHTVLENLYRRNLFLIQVGETGKVYRYHALFAEFLLEQLKSENPKRFTALHRLAAEAQKTTAPARAVAHYLAAELWDEAAQTIEQASESFLRQGMFKMLHSWIEALPPTIRDVHPRLLYILGVCALQRGELEEAVAVLESARQGFEARGDRAGLGEVLLELVSAASLQQDHDRRAAFAQQALTLPLPVHGQVQLLMARVWELLHQGDLKEADKELGKAFELTLACRDLRAFNVVAPIFSMHLAFLPSGTAHIESYCRKVISILGEGASPVKGSAHTMLSFILFLKGSIDEADIQAEKAREICRQVGSFAMNESQMHYVTGLLKAVRGDYVGAEHYWESVLPWIEQTPSLRFFQVAYLYVIGHMQWLQHKYEQARSTNARISMMIDSKELPYAAKVRKMMQALVEISDQRISDAEETLQQALAIEDHFRPSIGLGSARVMLAYLYWKIHREREAWSHFSRMLDECEKTGMPGLIMQECKSAVPLLHLAERRNAHKELTRCLLDILDNAGEAKPVPVPDTGETLTPREVEVLKLIVDGASNQTIAQQLVISEHTVKVHISNIFGKLNVSSRTKAAARAQELHLIG